MMPATNPMTNAPLGSTKPAAGVIATRPAMAPDAMPSRLGLPLATHSTSIHATAADAAPICVTAKAIPARLPAASAEPALNPNQPTHSREVPIRVRTRLWGAIGSLP